MSEGNIQSNPRFCTNCGSPVFEGQTFCPNCGHRLLQPQQVFGQPVPEKPQNAWGQVTPEQSQQIWGQPVPEQPQNAWGQVTPTQDDLKKIPFPYEEQPQAAPTVEESVQPEHDKEEQQPWQQPVQNPYGQMYNQQGYYGQQAASEQPVNGQPSYNTYMNEQNTTNVPTNSTKKKKIVLFSCLGAGMLLLIVATLFIINYFSYTRLDASKIYRVEYEGVNGKGKAYITVDQNNEEVLAIYDQALRELDLKKSYAISSISYMADPYENLSNGDKIKVTVDYNEEEFNKYKIKLTNTTFEIQVEGLKDASDYDLFKDVKVNFEGVSGFGSASIDTSGCDTFASIYVSYDFDKYPVDLKNGDIVTVVASVDEEDLYDNGYTTDVFEKKYTVEGLQEPQRYDVFKDIKLVYEGISPYLTVSVDISACEEPIKDNVYFYITDNANKKNGDTVIVEAQFDKDYLRSLGYEITETKKTFTIENQGEMLNEVDASAVTQMDTKLASIINNWMKENGEEYLFDIDIKEVYGEDYTLKEAKTEVTNRYFGTKADGDPYNNYAVIATCTYTIQGKNKTDTKTYKYYIFCTLDNVSKQPDGTYTFVEPETFLGFEDINEAINKLNESGYSYTEVKAQ